MFQINVNRLNSVVPKLLKNKKVLGVHVIFEAELKDGNTILVSDYVNDLKMQRYKDDNSTIYKAIMERIKSHDTGKVLGNLKFIYMKIVYKKNT